MDTERVILDTAEVVTAGYSWLLAAGYSWIQTSLNRDTDGACGLDAELDTSYRHPPDMDLDVL